MVQTDILIIGAGAAGLAAAYELSLADKKLIVLEARDRFGGRIHSIKDNRFAQIVEAGAEFIHGKLPATFTLLEKAGIKYHAVEGKMWRLKNSQVQKTDDFIIGWEKLIKNLRQLKEDLHVTEFLTTYFPGDQDKELRNSVIQFVQGYDAADAHKASSFALRDEWENDDDGHQYRIDNGYIELINFLTNKIKENGNTIVLSQVVKSINWQKGKAEAITADGQRFIASKVLITIPVGVWQSENSEGYISFTPELTEKNNAIKKMGYGTVIKINLQFQNNFWEEETANKLKNAGFIFSDSEIPTWWTGHPKENGLLVGWLAGPNALKLRNATEKEILEKALQSLAYIFAVKKEFIANKLLAYYITNWSADNFSCGAYSYATLDTHLAKNILRQPIEQTLYFAGEALYEGTETGTVECALANGIEMARKIIIHSLMMPA